MSNAAKNFDILAINSNILHDYYNNPTKFSSVSLLYLVKFLDSLSKFVLSIYVHSNVCVCVCVCARARACVCVYAYKTDNVSEKRDFIMYSQKIAYERVNLEGMLAEKLLFVPQIQNERCAKIPMRSSETGERQLGKWKKREEIKPKSPGFVSARPSRDCNREIFIFRMFPSKINCR